MNTHDLINLFFGGMEKLGPGSNADTLYILGLLPKKQYPVIVDAGCGTGRQTLVLAKELNTLIHAVDIHEPFLEELLHRSMDQGIQHLIKVRCMNLQEIPTAFPSIDLLWSEGAAYNIGFANALKTWASVINPGGFAAISEMTWMRDEAPAAAREFFQSCYPEMKSIEQNLAIVENAGYRILTMHTLARETWMEGYYDILGPRAQKLLHHPDAAVRDFAMEMIREIDVFELSENSYGYVFYLLQRC
jgi:ubiquinone/menaquinone biosynthesis C-methylase UbiE